MIAILAGGYSAERAVSLRSGQNVYQALQKKGVHCFLFDVQKVGDKDNLAQLFAQDFDHAFIVLHGRGGEDGFIQAQLEKRHIPFSGAGSAVSALCMDKAKTKQVWQENALPTAPFTLSYKGQLAQKPNFCLPWIVKPANEGSSIGISKVSKHSQLEVALKLAHEYDKKVIIEQYLSGKEYTIGIVQNLGTGTSYALPIIEIAHRLDFLDYQAKYFDKKHQVHHHCPAPLDTKSTKSLQTLALQAFGVLNCRGWGRIDIITQNNTPYLLEINTAPGMTPASLIPIAIKAINMDMADFVQQVLGLK